MLLWVCRPPCDADYFLDIWLGLIANASLYIYIWCYSFGRGFGLLSTSTSCVYKYMNMELIVSRGAFALHQFGSTHTHTEQCSARRVDMRCALFAYRSPVFLRYGMDSLATTTTTTEPQHSARYGRSMRRHDEQNARQKVRGQCVRQTIYYIWYVCIEDGNMRMHDYLQSEANRERIIAATRDLRMKSA